MPANEIPGPTINAATIPMHLKISVVVPKLWIARLRFGIWLVKIAARIGGFSACEVEVRKG